MDDAGFPVEYTHQGGLIGHEVPADQADLANATMTRCMDEAGANDPYTDEQLSQLYDLEVRDYKCLIAAGFAPSEPPSRQQFLDSYHTQQRMYQAYATVGDANQPAAAKACTPARWEF
ncbi:hypothetical protein QT381_14105 [Galbitalea sp. SE-J8]|uniref:hypothetical protein n=1 Tax=Galbitalea sp. SE-J8 TaxID=3054952 RepID=UPI00259C877A|nr:hypothetical protein [Galbitalea sp. SE-J8]MDM4764140.1 hypothetical protein [Galbitalea sp. SE-J8]